MWYAILGVIYHIAYWIYLKLGNYYTGSYGMDIFPLWLTFLLAVAVWPLVALNNYQDWRAKRKRLKEYEEIRKREGLL
jgi:hypothetical protein